MFVFVVFVAVYSVLLLGIPCLFVIALAFLLPLDLAKKPRNLNYKVTFALLSVLLGVTLFQFLLWHTRPSTFEGVSAILFDLSLFVVALGLWIYGLRLARRPSPSTRLRSIMLLVTATSALVIDTRTAILVGHWVDETGRSGSSLFVNVIGIISFAVTMFLAYRLVRSVRRERLLRGYERS